MTFGGCVHGLSLVRRPDGGKQICPKRFHMLESHAGAVKPLVYRSDTYTEAVCAISNLAPAHMPPYVGSLKKPPLWCAQSLA